MLHARVVAAKSCSESIVDFLVADPRVTNVVVHPGAARDPVGDAIGCDIAREAVADVLATLRRLGLDRHGTIAIEEVAASPSRAARAAEQAAPGSPDDGVVWDLVIERAWDDSRASWAFYAFMVLATSIAGIAVVLDSSVLVVGAMVVGPEFGAVTAVVTGLVLRHRRLVTSGLRLLALGFALAVVATSVFGLAARLAGWIEPSTLTQDRPLTAYIWTPDHWSFVVALLAGAAGTLSLTAGRSNVLVGVFISVTTIPAAGNLALALALWVPEEMAGSAAQLGINLFGMVLAGSVTMLAQRVAWASVGRRRGRATAAPLS